MPKVGCLLQSSHAFLLAIHNWNSVGPQAISTGTINVGATPGGVQVKVTEQNLSLNVAAHDRSHV
jgi:hypothetical protein